MLGEFESRLNHAHAAEAHFRKSLHLRGDAKAQRFEGGGRLPRIPVELCQFSKGIDREGPGQAAVGGVGETACSVGQRVASHQITVTEFAPALDGKHGERALFFDD